MLVALQREALARARRRATALDALDAADAEDELLERLEDARRRRAVAARRAARRRRRRRRRGSTASRALAGPGDRRRARAGSPRRSTARGLAAELQESTRADVRPRRRRQDATPTWTAASSSRSTCTRGSRRRSRVLGHKLKHTSIEVVRDYDRTLPKLTVRGSELNQVWTNLLDNAIDALGERGTITITHAPRRRLRDRRHRRRRPGHPAGRSATASSTRSSPPRTSAQGTGLGLATARRIVVDRHDGSLTVRVRARPHDVPRLAALTRPEREAADATCTHLDHVHVTELPEAVDGCEDCLADRRPVAAPAHLPRVRPRRLLRQLARAGTRARTRAATEHPIIRSLEPGEDWSWCFVDEVAMRIPRRSGRDADPALAAPRLSGRTCA